MFYYSCYALLISNEVEFLLVLYVPPLNLIISWHFARKLHLHAFRLLLDVCRSQEGLGVGRAGSFWFYHPWRGLEVGCPQLLVVAVSMGVERFSVFAQPLVQILFAKAFGSHLFSHFRWLLSRNSLPFGLSLVNNSFLYIQTIGLFGLRDNNPPKNLCL